MGYRELHRMEIEEVVRRWQAQESQRAIARATGLARETVKKYLAAAIGLGLSATGPPPSSAVMIELQRLGIVAVQPVRRVAPQVAMLEPYREQIATWLDQDQLLLTRIQELLAGQGVAVKYTTLRRYVRQAGLWKQPRSTVRMAPTAPGEVAEMDFGKLGTLVNPVTGKRQVIYGLLVVLVYSRHAFVWPLLQQTLEATIEGLEEAWRFLGGLPVRLVLDNFPAAVAGPDALNPRPTRAFLEYSQARGLLLDPARVRHPKDKPHVENGVRYARERWWKGGQFSDLADARQQAAHWCREVAGLRVHGTTRRLPRVVFEDEERKHLQPYDGVPYDVPLWREVTVHPDHHVSVQYALYSAPSTTCPPGSKLEARCDRTLVRLYRRSELVKVHPRQPKGGRSTDADDYPPERTAYAMRAPDRVVQQALKLGPNVGHFAERLLDGTFPWAKLRQGQKLLRLADRYTAERLDAACARALGFDLLEVRRVERILVLALDHEGLPAPPPEQRVQPLPLGRFARPGTAFDHRYSLVDGATPPAEVPS
jgi:transposase